MKPSNEKDAGNIRVLVFEDQQSDADQISRIFLHERLQGLKLKFVRSMAEGITSIHTRLPEIILLNLNIEDHHGFSAFDRVHAEMPSIPIIIMSNSEDNDLATEALSRGAKDYLIKKEMDEKNLWRIIHYLLEQSRFQKALDESVHRYRLLTENMMDVIWSIDLSFRFVTISPSVFQLRGFTEEEALKQPIPDVLTPESLQSALKIITDQLAEDKKPGCDKERSWLLELEQIRKDGSTVWTENKMTFMRDVQGKPNGVLGVSREISKHKEAEHKFRLAEEKYKKIFENSAVAITVTDENERITQWNKYAEKMLGMTHDDLYMKPVRELYSEDEWTELQALNLRQRGMTDSLETHVFRKDGVRIDVDLSVTVLKTEDGGKTGSIGIMRDITERKQAALKLEMAEERYRTIFENSAVAITVTDEDERIVDWNKRAEELFGLSGDQLRNKFVKELYPEEEWKKMQSLNLRQKGIMHHHEAKALRADGELIDIDISVTVLKTADGGKTGSIGIIQDVTESKRVQKQIFDAEERYRSVFENSAVAITMTDEQERIVSWNKYAERILGMTYSDLYMRPVKELYEEQEWKKMQSMNIRKKGMMEAYETQIVRKDGSKLDIDISVTVLKTADGGKTGSIGIIRDISERKKSEVQMKKLSTAIEQNIDRVVITNVNGIIEYANPAFEKASGYTKEEALGKNPRILKSGQHQPSFYTKLWETIMAGKPFRGVFINKKKNGEIYYEDQIITPLKDEDGNITHFVSVAKDVTETRRIERERQDAEARYRTVFENSAVAITMTDEEERIVSWNKYAEELLGMGEEDLRMKPVKDLYTPEEWGRLQSLNLRKKGMMHRIEAQMMKKDGSPLDVDISVTVLKTEDGGKTGSIGIFSDRTDEKHAQEQLRAAEEKYRTIFDNSPVAITIANKAGNLISWNRFAEELLGRDAEGLMLKPIADLYPKEEWNKIMALNIRGAGTAHFETKIIRGNGELMDVETSVSILQDDNGNITGSVGIIRDITERNKMISEINRAKDDAERANRTKGEFLSNMSHEIRTPMNGIMGMIGLLLDTQINEEQREYANYVNSSAESLLALINDILDFSKIEAGKMTLDPIPFDLAKSAEEIAMILAPKAEEKDVELILRFSPRTPARVIGDPGRIRQILMNLTTNAIKFTHQGYVLISVDMIEQNGRSSVIQFSVQDTGIGIPQNKLNDIFEKFTQADASTTRRYGGTGLGLAICKQLVELMGGKIYAKSEEGKGSVFVFELPLPLDKVGTKSLPKADLTGIKAIIVDDIEINRIILEEQLTSWGIRHESYDSSQAGLAALYKAHNDGDPFQIALLDFQMPDMDGAEMAHKIKNDALIKDTVLVMLTSVGNRGDCKKLEEIGLAAYLLKPVRKTQLYEALSVVWGAKQQGVEMHMVTRHVLRESVEKAKSPVPISHQQLIEARVLLAEDNPVNQKVAKKMIEKLGCSVEVVSSGVEVLKILEKSQFDLIFMDCQMPEMDGYEATREIRKKEKETGQHIPIIALTANAMSGDKDKCLDAGMDDYISKPVKSDYLTNVFTRWMSKRIDGQSSLTVSTTAGNSTDNGGADLPNAIDPDRIHALSEFADEGDEEFLDDLFDTFFTTVEERTVFLRKAVEQNSPLELQRQAHTIKGSSRNLGALHMAEICEKLENIGKSGTVEGAAPLMQKLLPELARVKLEYQTKWRGANGSSSDK